MISSGGICCALLALLAIFVNPAISFSNDYLDTPISKKMREQLVKLYEDASEKMKLCSPAYAPAPSQRPELWMRFILPTDQPKVIAVSGIDGVHVYMHVRASSMRWVGIVNSFLCNEYKPPSGWQKTPTLTREAAVERAKEYLKVFKIEVPQDYKLTKTDFGGGGTGCWRVLWCRFSGQYPWDDESLGSETVFVDFYEKEGLSNLSAGSCNCPAPRSLKVKISKEEAIAKATRYLNRTWYDHLYKVMGQTVVTSVGTCELRVSAPRLGAPAEGDKLSEGQPPRETRLCWKTDLGTMSTVGYKNKNSTNKHAGEVVVWIDAETGAVMRSELLFSMLSG